MIQTLPLLLGSIPLIQEVSVGAGDLPSLLTLKEITIGGLLVCVCVYMGWKNNQLSKELKESQAAHVADLKAHASDYKDEAEKFHKSFEQIRDLYNERINRAG